MSRCYSSLPHFHKKTKQTQTQTTTTRTELVEAEAHQLHLALALLAAQPRHHDAFARCNLLVARVHEVGQRLERV
jgi:hypothetical protein